ncbi:ABC transporter ATP-binding protein [Chloroflexota bacterium]
MIPSTNSNIGDPPPTWIIDIRGLTKSFGSKIALKNIDLKIKRGERFAVFGPNGAGKTTLIKLLSTIAEPSAGSIHVDGMDIRRHAVKVRRKIGMVGHQTFLYDTLTVQENLRFCGKMYNVPDLELKINEAVDRLQLRTHIHSQVGILSRGLQQRASIARAVLHNPSIMLLDEPEVGLDPHAITMMREVLDTLNSTGCTVVMTTHNLERGLQMSDQVVILNKGKIVYQALTSQIDTANFHETYREHTGTGK